MSIRRFGMEEIVSQLVACFVCRCLYTPITLHWQFLRLWDRRDKLSGLRLLDNCARKFPSIILFDLSVSKSFKYCWHCQFPIFLSYLTSGFSSILSIYIFSILLFVRTIFLGLFRRGYFVMSWPCNGPFWRCYFVGAISTGLFRLGADLRVTCCKVSTVRHQRIWSFRPQLNASRNPFAVQWNVVEDWIMLSKCCNA